MTPEVLFAPGTEARDAMCDVLRTLPFLRRTATIIPARCSDPYQVLCVKNGKSPAWMLAGGGIRLDETEAAGLLREWRTEELPVSSPYAKMETFRHFAAFHILPSPGETISKPLASFVEGWDLPSWLAGLVSEVRVPLSVGLDTVFSVMMADETPVGIRESDEAEITAWIDLRRSAPGDFAFFHCDIAAAWRAHVESGFKIYPDPRIGLYRLGGQRPLEL